MKKKTLLIAPAIVITALLFTALTYYSGRVSEYEIEHSRLTNSIVRLEDKLMKQVSAIRYKLPDSTWVYNRQKERVLLASVAETEPRLCLYADRFQCESCWQAELGSLAFYHKKDSGLPAPALLAANYNIREVKLLAQRNNTDIPMYVTEEIPVLQHIARLRKPFFFVLEPGGVVSSVYFPDEQSITSDSTYFTTIARRYLKTVAPTAQSTGKQKGFHIPEADIDLGDIGLRKKQEVVFCLVNDADTACDILDIRLSCSCMMLQSMPQRVLPGETGEIRVDIIQLSKGPFSRTIELRTSSSDAPYMLNIKGNVV